MPIWESHSIPVTFIQTSVRSTCAIDVVAVDCRTGRCHDHAFDAVHPFDLLQMLIVPLIGGSISSFLEASRVNRKWRGCVENRAAADHGLGKRNGDGV